MDHMGIVRALKYLIVSTQGTLWFPHNTKSDLPQEVEIRKGKRQANGILCL